MFYFIDLPRFRHNHVPGHRLSFRSANLAKSLDDFIAAKQYSINLVQFLLPIFYVYVTAFLTFGTASRRSEVNVINTTVNVTKTN